MINNRVSNKHSEWPAHEEHKEDGWGAWLVRWISEFRQQVRRLLARRQKT